MRTLKLGMLVLALTIFFVSSMAQAAQRKDPTFPQMVKDSSQIIEATVKYVGKEEMKVAIQSTLKGTVSGEIAIGSYYEKTWQPLEDLRDHYKEGQRYIFFLKDSLVGNVPYSPTRRSVDIPVKGTRVDTSLLAPGFKEFAHPIKTDLFIRYIKHLNRVQSGEDVDQAFVGEMLDGLQTAAKDPNKGDEQLVYLAILNDIKPLTNVKLIEQLLKSGNINVRYLALLHVRSLPKKTAVAISLKMLNDPKGLIQSLAAKNLELLEAFGTIKALTKYIKPLKDNPVERCAADPIGSLESPKRAVLRALISFDSEEALDVIEKTLLSRDVISFRIILDVFKEYEDESIHLLLLELMQDRNFLPLQVAILDYFQAVKNEETIAHLKELYDTKEAGEFIRKSIVEVLESYKDPKVLDFFLHSLEDNSALVRQASAKAVGTLQDPGSVEALKKNYFREPNRLAREFYVDALSKIPDRTALDALKELYDQEVDKKMKKTLKQAIKSSRFLAQ